MSKQLSLSTIERAALLSCVQNGLEEHRFARRANAILLLADGMSPNQVAKVLFLDDSTIYQWLKEFHKNGFDGLMTLDYKGSDGYLSKQQIVSLIQWITESTPRSTTAVGEWLFKQFDISFQSRSSLIKLLNRHGFEFRKPGQISKNLDPVKQKKFITEYEKLKQNQEDDEVIVFADAVHPTFMARPVGCWVLRGEKVVIEQNSGRGKINIHGAINLETGETKMVEAQMINADSTIDLLQKLEQQYPTKRVIHVILDNARYHHACKVSEWLGRKNCKIKLHFLPSYCPHLNPIERLWGVMHKNITHNRSHVNMRKFSLSVLGFLNETVPSNWAIYCDQISDNFRIISPKNYRILK